MPTIGIDGIATHYEIAGSGPHLRTAFHLYCL